MCDREVDFHSFYLHVPEDYGGGLGERNLCSLYQPQSPAEAHQN